MGAAEKSMMTRVKEQEMGRLLPSALRTPLRPFVTLLTAVPSVWEKSVDGLGPPPGQCTAEVSRQLTTQITVAWLQGKYFPRRGCEPENKAMPSKKARVPF